jgi:hypothetical protein
VFLHHETYRLLTHERMTQYLREAALDRQIRIAALPGRADDAHRRIGAAARVVRAVVRALAPSKRERGAVCADPRQGAS